MSDEAIQRHNNRIVRTVLAISALGLITSLYLAMTGS